jgi:hypothetical protein
MIEVGALYTALFRGATRNGASGPPILTAADHDPMLLTTALGQRDVRSNRHRAGGFSALVRAVRTTYPLGFERETRARSQNAFGEEDTVITRKRGLRLVKVDAGAAENGGAAPLARHGPSRERLCARTIGPT